jgi:F0F1-type ATP synthase assembly protein I
MSAPPSPELRAAQRRQTWRGLEHANTVGVEMVTAVLLWAGLGWLVDRWLGTDPWFLAIGAIVGNVAGIYLIWLHAQRMDRQEAADAAAATAVAGRLDP